MALTVSAGCIVVPVKGADRYLYKGAVLPDGIEATDLKRLKSIGLVKEVKVATRPRATSAKQDESAADSSAAEVTDEGTQNSAPESEASADENTKSQSRTKK